MDDKRVPAHLSFVLQIVVLPLLFPENMLWRVFRKGGFYYWAYFCHKMGDIISILRFQPNCLALNQPVCLHLQSLYSFGGGPQSSMEAPQSSNIFI